MNAKTQNMKTAEAKIEHSILWNFFDNEASHFVSKMSVVVALLKRSVDAMTATMREHSGAILSKRNGGAKATTESAVAKQIVDFFGSNLELYFVECAKECAEKIPAVEGMAERGSAVLGAVNVKDTGNGTYAITSGSLLIRFRASLMTLAGDWSYLHSHKTHPAVVEFINKWQERSPKGSAMGFSPKYAFSYLAKDNCAELLEQVACHKTEVSNAISDKPDGTKQGAAEQATSVEYTPQVKELLQSVDLLKKAIVAVADNASVAECEDWQKEISALIELINPQISGDSEGAAKNLAPEIADANEPVATGNVASK